jgi:Ca2+-binding EF-hand superfamily protein
MESTMTRRAHKMVPTIAACALAAACLAASPARARMLGSFDAADTNHDGRVTFQEFDAYEIPRLMAANGPLAQRFKALSPEQQAARLQQRFGRLDSGGKGYLDRNDWNGD